MEPREGLVSITIPTTKGAANTQVPAKARKHLATGKAKQTSSLTRWSAVLRFTIYACWNFKNLRMGHWFCAIKTGAKKC